MNVARSARLCLAVGASVFILLRPNPGMSGSDQPIEAGDVPGLAGDYRHPVIVDTLRQNKDNRFRLIVPDKCAADGERELRKMAAEGAFEEAYVFLPSRCLWIELGSDESATSVRSDAKIVLSLVSGHEPLVVYHTHVRSQTELSGGFPAFRDLLGSIFLGGNQPLIEGRPIVHRAVTIAGTFEYALAMTPEVIELIENLRKSGLGEHVAQNLAYVFAGSDYRQIYHDLVASCARHGTGDGRVNPDCFPISSRPFTLSFRSAIAPD